MSEDGLIYTTTFKTYHIEIESGEIQLSRAAWIEKSDKFKNQPGNFDPYFFHSFEDPQFGLSRFDKQLVESVVRLKTIHTAKEGDETPFQLHDCSHIAIALSILYKPWFVVGIETFENNRNANPGYGPYISFFIGDKEAGPVYIPKQEESRLMHIYNFVYSTLTSLSWESDDARLLLLFVRCVLRTPSQRFAVLKLSLEHLFSEWHATILNAALFFEFLLTKESHNYSKGIQKWNEIFTFAQIDDESIDKVFRYRHLVAHSNPTKAIKVIDEWKMKIGFDDLKISELIRKVIWSTAKNCMLAVIENDALYKRFQSEKPD